MHFFKIAALFTGLLATSEAASIRLHSLNHCQKSPIDLACGNIGKGQCCVTRSGGHARSVTFLGAKGNVGYTTNKNCKTIYKARLRFANTCFFHTGPRGTYHGALYRNPLTRFLSTRDECNPDSVDDSNISCDSVQPDLAIVNGEETFNIKDMSFDQVDALYTLAENQTSANAFPSDLTKFIVPTENWTDDLGYEEDASETE